jgi:hypothetical protein
MSKGLKVIPSADGECEYEAYHTIFSWLTSTIEIYEKLAEGCGSQFVRIEKKEESKMKKDSTYKTNTIFCLASSETHYYYKGSNGQIYDPYEYFQLYHTHGNCFAFALYFAERQNHPGTTPPILMNASIVTEKKGKGAQAYTGIIESHKQLAYQIYVYNDYMVVQWLLSRLTKEIIANYIREWNSIEDVDKTEKGIPLDSKYKFKDFLKQFIRLAKNMKNTYMMTWDQIINWDLQGGPAHRNSGIPDAVRDIDVDKYKIDNTIVSYLG